MRAKLFSIPEPILNQVIDLEAEAMLPILTQSDIKITKDEIVSEIRKDREQEVIIVLRKDRPRAWIRYGVRNDTLFVKSIQINRNENSLGSLRELFGEVVDALKEISNLKIESVVQKANAKSILLHEKLGFTRGKENPKAIRFSIDSDLLLANLKRFS